MARSRFSSRRLILGALAFAPALVLFARRGQAQADDAGACVTSDDDGMPGALNYVDASPHGAERACRTCEFWTAAPDAGCGVCAMMRRSTVPTGYCDSWARRAAAAAAQ